jgi:hypothetical protein
MGVYGSSEMVGWLVDERGIEPHVNLIDKAERTDGSAPVIAADTDCESRSWSRCSGRSSKNEDFDNPCCVALRQCRQIGR